MVIMYETCERETWSMSVLAALREEEYDKGTSRGSEMKRYQSHRGGRKRAVRSETLQRMLTCLVLCMASGLSRLLATFPCHHSTWRKRRVASRWHNADPSRIVESSQGG